MTGTSVDSIKSCGKKEKTLMRLDAHADQDHVG